MRLLVLGTGSMAAHHVQHFSRIEGVSLAAAVDVLPGRAAAFAAEHGFARAFDSLDEAIAWGGFDAATNVTPDAEHHPTTMKLLSAGKHVLCEKPLAVSHADALEMTEAAEGAGLVGMVNLTYRNVAALQAARRMVAAGEIGTVRHVEAAYLQSWLSGQHWGDWRTEARWLWRLSSEHGSKGVLGDVGIHILDFASFGADLGIERLFCRLKTFDKAPGNRIGAYPLDANDSFSMTVEFDNGALGVVHASRWASGYANTLTLKVFGDRGGLEIEHGVSETRLRVCSGPDVDTQTWRSVDPDPVPTNYDRFVAAVRAGRTQEPSFRRAADLQAVIDGSFTTEADRREIPAHPG